MDSILSRNNSQKSLRDGAINEWRWLHMSEPHERKRTRKKIRNYLKEEEKEKQESREQPEVGRKEVDNGQVHALGRHDRDKG